ncbi:MAG: hypothetical protein RR325_02510, partial [Bacilli bacterium]
YDKEEIDKKVMRTKLKWMKQEGIEQGIEQGIIKKGEEIVINFLNNNVDIDMIMKITNYSKEQIEQIKKDNFK